MEIKKLRKFFFIAILHFTVLSHLFCEEQDFVGDLGQDFSLSLYSLKELFTQQNDGSLNFKELFIISAAGIILIFLSMTVIEIIRKIIFKKRQKKLEAEFQTIKSSILKVKFDSITGSQFTHIIDEGIAFSKKIDRHTGRANTWILPILVYKIARKLKCTDKTLAVYFCASLFYDAGFLEVPSEFFFGEILTNKEKMQFKKHVLCFDSFISNLPEELYKECFNACSFHHENFDGSGYPESLSQSEIPLIGRIIRVVESYISLISKVTYHRGLSTKKAIRDLHSRINFYDPVIVDILENLV